MKLHLIFLVTVISYSGAYVFDNIENIGAIQAKLLFYLTFTGKSGCANYPNEEMMVQHNKTEKCLKNIVYDGSFCNTFLKKFKPCLTPVLEATAKCTTPFTNSLNIAVVDATLSEIEFLCNSDGEHILELLNPCVITSALQGYDCKTTLMRPYRSSFNLTETCSVFHGVQKCLDKEIRKECQSEITRKTLHNFFSVNVKPCNVALEGYMEGIKFIFRK